MKIESIIRIPLHDGISIRVWRDRTGGAASVLKFPYNDLDIQGSVIAHSSDLIKMMKLVLTLKDVIRVELVDKMGNATAIER